MGRQWAHEVAASTYFPLSVQHSQWGGISQASALVICMMLELHFLEANAQSHALMPNRWARALNAHPPPLIESAVTVATLAAAAAAAEA